MSGPQPVVPYAAVCPCGVGLGRKAVKSWEFDRSRPDVVARQGRCPPSEVPTCLACHHRRPDVAAARSTRIERRSARKDRITTRWQLVRRVLDDVKTWLSWVEADEADPDGTHLEDAERALKVSADLLVTFDDRGRHANP